MSLFCVFGSKRQQLNIIKKRKTRSCESGENHLVNQLVSGEKLSIVHIQSFLQALMRIKEKLVKRHLFIWKQNKILIQNLYL